jgi:hypothetical protein
VKSDPPVAGETGVLQDQVPSAAAGSPTNAEIAAFKAGVLLEDGGDLSSAFSFFDGDQPVTKRAWSRNANVKIKSVWAKYPSFELVKDTLKDAEVHCTKGSFDSPDFTAGNEKIILPAFVLKSGGKTLLKIQNLDPALDTSFMGIQNSEKFNGVVVTFPPVKCEFLKS